MKTKSHLRAAWAALFLLATAPLALLADETTPKPEGDRHAAMLKRFDKNGDGVLDDAEKAAAREAMAEQGGGKREKLRERAKEFDKDGDGQLNAEEKAAAQAAARAEMEKRPRVMKRFDADKDGKLSDTEFAAARDALKKRAAKGRGDEAPE